MDKIRVIIVEDEFVIAEDIRACLSGNGYDVVAVFDKGETALPAILRDTPDVLLVDIRLLGKMDGIELVQSVMNKIRLPVIYITANSDMVTYTRAKDTIPHAFLIKPFIPEHLLTSVDLALHNFNAGKIAASIARPSADVPREESVFIQQNIFVRVNGRFRKLSAHDLLYIEASGSYVHLQTHGDRYTLAQNLAQFQRKTPLPYLVRIHRSYIINIEKVESFDDSFVFLGSHKLPFGEQYRSDFLRKVHLL